MTPLAWVTIAVLAAAILGAAGVMAWVTHAVFKINATHLNESQK